MINANTTLSKEEETQNYYYFWVSWKKISEPNTNYVCMSTWTVQAKASALSRVAAAAAAALVAGGRRRRRGLPDLEDLDAAVGPLPDLDRHVLRAEGPKHAHPAVLPVDQVALQLLHLEQRPPDLVVAPVAVDVHPERHVVEPVVHGEGALPRRRRR